MAIQFSPKHTIAAHEASHYYEVEVFRDGEIETDAIETRPPYTSFGERVFTADLTIPDDCALYRIKVDFLKTYMDCKTLRLRKTWSEDPERYYFSVEREDLVRGSGSVPTFRLDYRFINSVSVICRFCTAVKEQTTRQVADAIDLLPDLKQLIVEYLYPKAESHFKEEAEKQEMIWEVTAATGFRAWVSGPQRIPHRTIMEYLYP